MLIIFDCDGVLVDSEVIANRVLAALLSRYGYSVTARECQQQFVGHTIPKVVTMVRDAGVDLPNDFEEELRALDIEAFERELQPVVGIEHALNQLTDVPKCVASSGPHPKIRGNLTHTNLLRFFDPHIFSARDVANPKPAPDLFHHAAGRMGFSAGDCIVIEDTDLGVEGAKRAGMTTIGFTGASHRIPSDAEMLRRAGADHILEDMHELPQFLKSIS